VANTLGITFEELQTRADEDFDTEDRRAVESRLDQAVRLLLGRRPALAAQITAHAADAATGVDRDVVIDVVWRAVNRTLSPAAGPYRSESEGDYRYEVNPLAASADLWFPDADLQLVTPQTSSAPRTARVTPSAGWRGW